MKTKPVIRVTKNALLDFRTIFLFEKLTESYSWYAERSLAEKNIVMEQELRGADCSAVRQAKATRYF